MELEILGTFSFACFYLMGKLLHNYLLADFSSEVLFVFGGRCFNVGSARQAYSFKKKSLLLSK
ncbi:MAG: hypothetical protein CVU06_00640 [Bacteroidetes bacterium HGW-Bacteroidetes-22]|nr:MAG: hypothetical protein CVU06_00640 [Bacteroidetes bacterium HGW-Bacteroidetes-22]